MSNHLFDKANELINGASTIVIATHVNTDGDAVGSSLGLYNYLKDIGKNVDIFIDSVIPENLITIPGVENINEKTIRDYDLLICLDSADEFRLGRNRDILHRYELRSLQFDHHEVNSNFCKTNIVEVRSSTCEMIADFLIYLNAEITSKIARCLITGIYTDTGRLGFSSVKPQTFMAVAELLSRSGMSIDEATYPLYNSVTMKEFEVRKIGYSKVEFYEENQVAIVALSYEDIAKLDLELFMTKSLVDLAMPLKNIKCVVLMTEFTPNTVFCSIRTKGDVSAKRLAAIYGGNGHPNAAGCKMRRCIFEAEKKIMTENAIRLVRGTL